MAGARPDEAPREEGEALRVLFAAVCLVVITSLVWFWVARAPERRAPATVTVRPLETLDTRR